MPRFVMKSFKIKNIEIIRLSQWMLKSTQKNLDVAISVPLQPTQLLL